MTKKASLKPRSPAKPHSRRQSFGADARDSLQSRINLFCSDVGIALSSIQEPWDRQLTEDEFNHLRAAHKGQRALISFIRKVSLMVEMLDNSDLRETVPWEKYETRTALRNWYDPSRKLWTWKVALIDSPTGHYEKLAALYVEVLAALDAIFKGKNFSLRQQVEEQKRIIADLEKQNLALAERIYWMTHRVES